MITTGNHVYRHREAYGYLDRADRVIRPANYPHANPGRGHTVVEADGKRVGVINLSGAVGLQVARLPFHEVDAMLERIEADCLIVDFHAEVTSEKVAMGWYLDGRVAAVFGTHTHVPTADGRVLPRGTAFISDVGMTGSRESVLGVKREQALQALVDADAGPLRNRRGGRLGDGRGGRGQRRGAGGLDRAGDGPGSALTVAMRDQEQRVEPDDVEVEPVLGGQLERRSGAPRRGRRPGSGVLRRGRKASAIARRPTPTRIATRKGSNPGTCPQMLNGESRCA